MAALSTLNRVFHQHHHGSKSLPFFLDIVTVYKHIELPETWSLPVLAGNSETKFRCV